MQEKSIFPVSPGDIPEEHSYHYANCFNESLAFSNNHPLDQTEISDELLSYWGTQEKHNYFKFRE